MCISYCAVYIARMGSQIIIPYRGDSYDARDLKVAGELGQILLLVICSLKFWCYWMIAALDILENLRKLRKVFLGK